MSIVASTRRIDVAPPTNAQAVLSPDFGRRFTIFADAEEEFDWSRPLRRNATATTAIAALPAATRRLNDRGVVPAYLVDFPVVDQERSAATMRAMVDDGECTFGTQLHPWVNPPFDEIVSGPNSFAGSLPIELERAKLRALTEKITETLGSRPVVYRAGRYGVGANTAALLLEQGYRMDVSVRSLFDYSAEGGADFTRHPITPYWLTDGLLEAPLTAGFIGALRRWPALFGVPRLRGPMAACGMLGRVPLTPEGTPLSEALTLLRHLLDNDVRLFSLSFHTPSVEIGHTPYVRDQADLRQFWAWWDGVFDLFARENVLPCVPADILAAAR
ncbi:MAG: WalW protein [Sphingomonas bacterium]|uniref:WalW protein n=1 Tax=Sphingomonas bacterium TaxID=1895847 RepID=UPI002638CF20|nr:WalW protein [Sphingomonas bacterium]MDB5694622.1 WalW protein [Sphingomonas bacterium]